jgi:hypothetical protein
MWPAWQMGMSFTVIGFILMSASAILFAGATMVRELNLKLPVPVQRGDSSLSRHSVNWLAATALISALVICFGLL